MSSADIQFQLLTKLLKQMDKRLSRIEEAVQKRGPGRPPKTIELPTKVNDA
jgi:hypothetical protein